MLLLEVVKFTPLIGALQGTVGPWSVVINVLLGVDAAGSYARIDRLPGPRKVGDGDGGAVAVAGAGGGGGGCDSDSDGDSCYDRCR